MKRTLALVPPAPGEVDSQDGRALSRIAHGEIGALGELYDRHQAAVRRFAGYVLGNASEAEDVVQDTFMVVARIASGFDGRQECRPWLLGIAAHVVRRRRRTFARWSRMLKEFSRHRQTQATGVEAGAHARAELASLAKALGKLSEAKRTVIVMAEVEGLSCDQIACALAIPIGTVWTRLHHARRELRAGVASRGEP